MHIHKHDFFFNVEDSLDDFAAYQVVLFSQMAWQEKKFSILTLRTSHLTLTKRPKSSGKCIMINGISGSAVNICNSS